MLDNILVPRKNIHLTPIFRTIFFSERKTGCHLSRFFILQFMESQRNYKTWPLGKRSKRGRQGLLVHLKDPPSLLSVLLSSFKKQMEGWRNNSM